MAMFTRREFLATTAAGVAVAVARTSADETAKRPTRGSDLVTLGRSGIQTSVLGVGTGTRGGREQLGLGQDGFTRLIRHAFDRGVRYIDTADSYSTHLFTRFAIAGVPRDEFFLQSKTRATHPEVVKADIERFRRELRVDYIDSLLMHCMKDGNWPTDMRPVMDVLSEAKEKGQVRAVGVSCHGPDPLAASVDCEWIDVQLARINPFGVKMDGQPEQVADHLRKMHAGGRGVLGMKIFGEGHCDTAEKRLQSLKFVLGLGCVDAFTIGFSTPEQIDETLDLIEKALAA